MGDRRFFPYTYANMEYVTPYIMPLSIIENVHY